jgi:hypothetical protein
MDNWIPEALQDAPFFKAGEDGTPKTQEAVLADLTNAASHMGNSLRIPSKESTPEQIAEFMVKASERIPGLMPTPDLDNPESINSIMSKLGKPGSLDGYKVPEGMNESLNLADIKAMAMDLGMTQSQFNLNISKMSERATEAGESLQTALATDREALKEVWGDALAKNRAEVAQFLALDPDVPAAVVEAFKADTLPADQVQWLHKLAGLGEEGNELQNQDGGSTTITPFEASERAGELQLRLLGMRGTEGNYQQLVAKRIEYMRIAGAGAH